MVAAKRRAKQTWADLENADTPAAADTSGAVLGSWWWQQRWHGPQFAHLVQRAQFCHANIFADDLGGELVCCDARRWRAAHWTPRRRCLAGHGRGLRQDPAVPSASPRWTAARGRHAGTRQSRGHVARGSVGNSVTMPLDSWPQLCGGAAISCHQRRMEVAEVAVVVM